MKKQSFTLLLIMMLCLTAQSQEQLQKVKIASGGHVVHFLPLDLAVALGYFKDEELEPDITYLDGGTATAQALISKQVDFSTNGLDHAFKAAAQGKNDLRMVVLLNQTPGMVLVVDSKYKDSVKSIADLKGMCLGVTSLGSASHMVLAFLLSKNGINLEDVTITKAGTSTFPPAIKNGSIDGGIAVEPFASIMVEQGDAYVLQRLITAEDSNKAFGGPYNLTGILTRQDVIDNNSELVRKIVAIHIRALKWIQTHSEEEIASVLPSEVTGSDRNQYIKTLRILREFYSPDGTLNHEGAKNVFDAMKLSGLLSPEFNSSVEKFLNADFIQEYSNGKARGKSTDKGLINPTSSNKGRNTIVVLALIAAIYIFIKEIYKKATGSLTSRISEMVQCFFINIFSPAFNLIKTKPKPWLWLTGTFIIFLLIFLYIVIIKIYSSYSSTLTIFNFIKTQWLFLLLSMLASFLISIWLIPFCWFKSDHMIKELKIQLSQQEKQSQEQQDKLKIEIQTLKKTIADNNKSSDQVACSIQRHTGLEYFSSAVLNAIDTSTYQLHLAINTPILHSFHISSNSKGKLEGYKRTMDSKHWSSYFCSLLVNKIDSITNKTNFDGHVLYLDPNWQRLNIRWFPFFERNDFKVYKESIDNFKKDISDIYPKIIFEETDMIPLWIGVIRSKNGENDSARLVLGLTGPETLMKGEREADGKSVDSMDISKRREFADNIAKRVVVLISKDIDIVNFFDEVFRRLTLRDYHIVQMLRSLIREGEHQGLDVMFRADYQSHKHGDLKPDKIKDVLYSRKMES